MLVNKIESNYNFENLKNSLANYVKDQNKLDKLIEFLKENILYGLLTSKDLFIDHNFDWVLSKSILKELKDSLEGVEIFSKNVNEYLKNHSSIAISVDEDYDIEEYELDYELKVNQNVEIDLYPTFPTFDSYSQKVEELFKNEEEFKDNEWAIYSIIEEFDKEHKKRYLTHSNYQYGGNIMFPTQSEYDNFLGSYFGEYGDAGSVYISVVNKRLYSSVDMF